MSRTWDLINQYDNNRTDFRYLKRNGVEAGSIGITGQAGFGVGVYTGDDLSTLNLTPMYDYENNLSANYGNYLHDNGSIMCFIPKYYYRIGHPESPRYSVFGNNTLDIVGSETFATEAEANSQGYALHRSFIDGGQEKSGFFIDKYIASKSPDNANIAISRRFGVPISLTTDINYTRSSGMTGCTGILADAVTLSKARGSAYNNISNFMLSALAMISLSHAQYSTSSLHCAWYDSSNTTNYPKGCNNSALGDVNDNSLSFITAGDAGSSAKPQTGSASNLAKTTHNGQGSGVVDLHGVIWEVGLGVTMPGDDALASATITNNDLYVLKESVALSSLTFDWNTATSAWGNATNLATKYDVITSGVSLSGLGEWISWGNGNEPVFYSNLTGSERALNGIVPPLNTALSPGGINILGNDGLYRFARQNLYVLSGGGWAVAGAAGVFSRIFGDRRSNSGNSVGFRSCCYGS